MTTHLADQQAEYEPIKNGLGEIVHRFRLLLDGGGSKIQWAVNAAHARRLAEARGLVVKRVYRAF